MTAQARILEQMFGAPPELIPVLGDLLADLSVLGGWTDELLDAFAACGLRAGLHVLDLGCGKGAISAALAGRFGVEVYGIDLYEPFIAAARERAANEGVAHLCRFETGDFRELIGRGANFDAVVMSAVGCELFGGYRGCIGAMRRTVRTGGLIALADGCLAETAPALEHEDCRYLRPRAAALRECTDHGDPLVAECIVDSEKVAATNRADTESIRRRAGALARQRPDLAAALADFIVHQERESEIIERWILETVWVFRKAPAPAG